MSFSVLEQLRSAHEDIENIEKAMSMVLMDKHKTSRSAVTCEHALKHLVETTQLKCKTAIDIYQDKDGMRTDDINALAGQRADKKGGDVWTSFYDKVKEVKDYHRRFSVNQGLPELQNSEWFYQRAMENDKTDSLFSGEEDYGKRVDMHELFVTYLNLKKISTLRKANFRRATYVRLKKKTVDLEPDDPEVDKVVEKEFHELDYIEWLKTFDQFHEISRYCKFRDKNYTDYLEGLISYLRGFLLRTQPLIDVNKLEQQFEKEFEERWNDKSIPGWQTPSHKEGLFCLPSSKLFNNESTKKHHENGKFYKKKLEEITICREAFVPYVECLGLCDSRLWWPQRLALLGWGPAETSEAASTVHVLVGHGLVELCLMESIRRFLQPVQDRCQSWRVLLASCCLVLLSWPWAAFTTTASQPRRLARSTWLGPAGPAMACVADGRAASFIAGAAVCAVACVGLLRVRKKLRSARAAQKKATSPSEDEHVKELLVDTAIFMTCQILFRVTNCSNAATCAISWVLPAARIFYIGFNGLLLGSIFYLCRKARQVDGEEAAKDVAILDKRLKKFALKAIVLYGIHWYFGLMAPLVVSCLITGYGLPFFRDYDHSLWAKYSDLRSCKLLIRGCTLAFTAGLFVPQVRKLDSYQWYIAQVDRFNPDNKPTSTEVELMAKVGEMARKVGGQALDLGGGSGNDLRTLQAAQPASVLVVEPNRFTWPQAETQGRELGLETSFAADLTEVGSASCGLLLTRRVLCSVDDQRRTLEEIFRVLKPGGVFVFIEHVAADTGSTLRTTQEILRPLQQAFANNCDPARDTGSAIRGLPWASLQLEAYDEAFNGPLSPRGVPESRPRAARRAAGESRAAVFGLDPHLVHARQKMSFEDQNKLADQTEEEDKRIARLESRAAKWHDLLSDAINETVAHLQKKQSQTVEEMEAEKEESDDDEEMEDDGADMGSNHGDDEERPIYNPLNLPLGWDGKPIPFWLYKLHGMGIEYKCEICGNYSYWGRRAFERHFQEWRHAFGMRCLKIPNTAHFKEITKIEEAITLYEKLKRDAEEQTFRPDQDVECEDIQGNVMSQKAFEDLRRQGLV
ncbi:unnamed protein product [Effrenium voratum]|uniref:Matrin-type domain-containing protein n=1 Tax=Effrenium voratum TaxID=2562239 RepID=A0AA36JPG0_9DINO|nr:unnamed protein product [Effrenium voratum]